MTNTDFLNLNSVRELLLFDIFDVDEFVLREIEKIKSNNLFDIWDLSKAKRYSYRLYQVGKDEYEEEEISTNEYLSFKADGDDFRCYTKLNYEDFEDNFPLQELDNWYDDEWLYEFHYNRAFFQKVIDWLDNTSGDASKSIRLRKLISALEISRSSLDSIKHGWKEDVPVNNIQKKVIQIFKRFDDVMLESIFNYYGDFFPKLFKKDDANQNEDVQSSRLEILNKLVDGTTNKSVFNEYEKKLISQKYLPDDRNSWLKTPSTFIRFYNYCENSNIFKEFYKDDSRGVKLLRKLYDFHLSTELDFPSKRKKQNTKRTKGEFMFLDII